MASHKKERSGSPAELAQPAEPREAPGNHADEPEQSLAGYATTIGVVTGLFGMLFAVGLILLPSATTRERVLVIGASLAVSVAGLTGMGAWRSPRRFGLTMLAGGLAIICLADLSIVAASGSQPAARAASRGTTTPRSSAHPTRQPSPAHRSSPAVKPHSTDDSSTITSSVSKASSHVVNPVFLSTLSGQPGSDQQSSSGQEWVGPAPGPWIMNKTEYSESLGYPELCNKTTPVIYYLDKPYSQFIAEVGIADGWSPEDHGVEAAFEVDWKSGSGGFRLLTKADTAPGDYPSLLQVRIPAGTTELQLTTNVLDSACMQGSTIVWGNARLTP
jgi:hypothetical protein